tara:strand:- start:182 stop:352 length:171 start_codon:yes stop_codon:yes gene_type:complete
MPYIPPHLRSKGLQPKKINIKYSPFSIAPDTKSKAVMWEEVRLNNYGKADLAYVEN